MKKMGEDSKEFFIVRMRDMDDAEDHFQKLTPDEHLIDKPVSIGTIEICRAVADAQLVGDSFKFGGEGLGAALAGVVRRDDCGNPRRYRYRRGEAYYLVVNYP